MGNRAVITTKNKDIGIYLHWNGGYDSVRAFLLYCKIKRFQTLEEGGWANLAYVIGNYFKNIEEVEINTLNNLDCNNYDNGLYITEKWDIVGREYHTGPEQNEYRLDRMLYDIDEAQPIPKQLGREKILDYLEKRKMTNDKTEI